MHADGLRIGIARKTAGIAQQRSSALGFLHLVEHWALDLSGNVHQSFIGPYGHDIIVLQTHVARQLAVE